METLENFLTTNIPPDDEEEDDLKQFVSQCDDRLKIINAKISELEAHLKFLNNEKAAILKVVASVQTCSVSFSSAAGGCRAGDIRAHAWRPGGIQPWPTPNHLSSYADI